MLFMWARQSLALNYYRKIKDVTSFYVHGSLEKPFSSTLLSPFFMVSKTSSRIIRQNISCENLVNFGVHEGNEKILKSVKKRITLACNEEI